MQINQQVLEHAVELATGHAGAILRPVQVDLVERIATMSEWAADGRVNVADAAVLLCQSAGRLVRSPTDRGMVAVLDPRLLRNNPFSYPEPTRRAYRHAYEQFGRRTSDLQTALEFLRTGRVHRPAA